MLSGFSEKLILSIIVATIMLFLKPLIEKGGKKLVEYFIQMNKKEAFSFYSDVAKRSYLVKTDDYFVYIVILALFPFFTSFFGALIFLYTHLSSSDQEKVGQYLLGKISLNEYYLSNLLFVFYFIFCLLTLQIFLYNHIRRLLVTLRSYSLDFKLNFLQVHLSPSEYKILFTKTYLIRSKQQYNQVDDELTKIMNDKIFLLSSAFTNKSDDKSKD